MLSNIYICRAPYKKDAPFVEHLEKALWYIKDFHSTNAKTTPRSLTKTESLLISKIQLTYLSGNVEEKLCGQILGQICYDIQYAYSLYDTQKLLETAIENLKKGKK